MGVKLGRSQWRRNVGECRLSESRVPRRIFGSKTEEVTGEWGLLLICTPHPILFG
jgi:hypothetical protein